MNFIPFFGLFFTVHLIIVGARKIAHIVRSVSGPAKESR